MTGDMMQQLLSIRADGWEILGRPRDPSRPRGLFVRKNGFQGWEGLPAGRREALARAVEHGEHDVPVYLPARVVTIDGWAIAPTVDELQHESDRLTGIGAAGRMKVNVHHRFATRFAFGRRTLAEITDEGRWTGRYISAPLQLQLLFADPRRYGKENVLPGDTLNPKNPAATATSIPVLHWGNFPAYPVIEIPAAPTAYTIVSPGGTFEVSGATAGGTHKVDLRRGRVFRNGVEMVDVGHGNLWAVPAGTTWVHTLSVPGRVLISDTFI